MHPHLGRIHEEPIPLTPAKGVDLADPLGSCSRRASPDIPRDDVGDCVQEELLSSFPQSAVHDGSVETMTPGSLR
jgi:hypothetical protein